MRIPKELYKDIPKLRAYCLRNASLYFGMVLAIDELEKLGDYSSQK